MSKKSKPHLQFQNISLVTNEYQNLTHQFPEKGIYSLYFDAMSDLDHFCKLLIFKETFRDGEIKFLNKKYSKIGLDEQQRIKQDINIVDTVLHYKEPQMTVYDFLLIPLQIKLTEHDIANQYIHDILEWHHQSHVKKHRLAELSKEEAYLISMLQAILNKPKLLITYDFLEHFPKKWLERISLLLQKLCQTDSLWLDLHCKKEKVDIDLSWMKTYHLYDESMLTEGS